MSARDEALREMAANRGCKLVKSRIRTPGRGDYGRYGLEDAKTGRQVLGFGKKGLTATDEEVEAFLRGGAAASWKSSVGATPARRTPAAKAARKPEPKPEPAPEPPLAIRQAQPKDAAALAELIVALGYDATAADVRARLAALRKAGLPALVALSGKQVVGCLTLAMTTVLHRPKPVGRISLLVVDARRRGQGIGAKLVEAAETWLRDHGCGLVEVTSNRKRVRAHGFYERLGYARTSYRFAKPL